eukprot:tig00001057_g6692.t1
MHTACISYIISLRREHWVAPPRGLAWCPSLLRCWSLPGAVLRSAADGGGGKDLGAPLLEWCSVAPNPGEGGRARRRENA